MILPRSMENESEVYRFDRVRERDKDGGLLDSRLPSTSLYILCVTNQIRLYTGLQGNLDRRHTLAFA